MENDWIFKSENNICNFRSAGVLIQNNKILVQRDKNGTDYALPGAHVKTGEIAEQTLIREYKEETEADIICDRMIWVEESFWTWNNKNTHTIAFYFLISLVHQTDLPDNGDFFSQKDNCDVVLTWLPIEDIQNISIYPSFIKEKINNISDSIEHFISIE